MVGENDAGKSTLLEAVNLALTLRLGGKPLAQVLSPYLVNLDATRDYVAALQAGEKPAPPEMIIDLFLAKSDETAGLQGTNNLANEDAPGVRIRIALNEDFSVEYGEFISDPATIRLPPIEYYQVDWLAFSGNGITMRGVPATASMINAASIRLQSGADFYLQNIIGTHLDHNERVELSRAYRSLREEFSDNPSVKDVNSKLSGTKGDISDRDLSLSIDISQRFTWESSLVPHLDDLPFQFVGSGEQSSLKILLALNRHVDDAHVILVEEPENHLSFSSLSILVRKIQEKCADKQILISTHSSYVLNKLGLESLILLRGPLVARLSDLPAGTEDYFKKLSGYDTLRLVLASKVILVEGPSDELIVQRAYRDCHDGRLPIEDGIDVINVRGLSFKRFLDIAVLLERETVVVTDNDGAEPQEVVESYGSYTANAFIGVHVGKDKALKTLEPQMLAANGRAAINAILGKDFGTDDELVDHMAKNKTTSALAIFETVNDVKMPEYISDAVG
jgi:hypothetical protein